MSKGNLSIECPFVIEQNSFHTTPGGGLDLEESGTFQEGLKFFWRTMTFWHWFWEISLHQSIFILFKAIIISRVLEHVKTVLSKQMERAIFCRLPIEIISLARKTVQHVTCYIYCTHTKRMFLFL